MNSAFVSSLEKSFIFLIFTSNLIKFNILSPSRYELRTPPRSSSQRRQLDLTLLAGQKVVKKYRRYARNNEFRRLKALVPSLLKKNEASKVKSSFSTYLIILLNVKLWSISKGRLISECLLIFFKFSKEPTKHLTNFCPRI